MHALEWTQVMSWQMRRQHLDARVPRSALLRVTSELCGLHAQMMPSAELTAWCRIDGLTRDDIRDALWKSRTLVKTWAMRGTVHLLPSSEFGFWTGVFRSLDRYRTPPWLHRFGVTPEEMPAIIEAIASVARGRTLTRSELATRVALATGSRRLGAILDLGWSTLLKPAGFLGCLCFGESAGARVRFTHPETHLGAILKAPKNVLQSVARRYFGTYGPATCQEFGRWLDAGPVKAREIATSMGGELEEVEVEGDSALMLKKDAADIAQMDPVRTVRLLPPFDQYTFAASPRSRHLMRGDFHTRIYHNAAIYSPVLLVDGGMEGVWQYRKTGNRLKIAIEPFLKAAARVRRAAEEEAERLAAFLGRPLELTWK